MKGTKIHYKGHEYNSDGDRPINLTRFASKYSQKQLKEAMADKELVFMHIGDNELYGINKLRFKRKNFLLLEPNPVTFYYSLAYDAVQQLEHARKTFSISLAKDIEPDPIVFSYVFKVTSVGIIFSFFALEAFMNQMIPDYGTIEFKGKQLSKNDLQVKIFDDKFYSIIPNITQKDFSIKYPKKVEIIKKLKELRNELSHLKEKRNTGFTSYDKVYQDILDVNLEAIVSTVKQVINFYHPGLIETYQGRTTLK